MYRGSFSRQASILLLVILFISASRRALPDKEAGVASVFPPPHAVAVDRGAPIVVTFDAPVDPHSINVSSVSVFGRWSGVMPGELRVEQNGTVVRFVPSRPFAAGEAVTVTLSREIKGRNGPPMSTGYEWSFWARSGRASLDLEEVGVIPVRKDGEGHVQTYGAYAGDFNGDGFSDLAVPNELANDVRVFLNDGHGDYGDATVWDIPSGAVPSPNEGADFNRDGIVDFAVGNAGNSFVSVFMGVGDGAFRHAGNHRAGRAVRGVCVMDLNGDGYADIATANMRGGGRGGNVSLLLNDGTGDFAKTDDLRTNARSGKTCAAADANGDGILDLFVGAYGSREVVVFLGDGQGGLEYHTKVPAGGSPWMIVAGDVNGDGNVDVVAANRNQDNMAILLGDGRGGLSRPTTYPVGGGPLAVDIGDIDGDGDLDAITSNISGKNFTLYENLGDGSFGNPRTLAASGAGSCAIIHDRDNDGDLDITGVDEIDDLIFLFENRPAGARPTG